MTSDSRDYFRGERAFRFEGWGGTPATWTLILVHSVLWLVYAGTVHRLDSGGALAAFFDRGISLSGADVVERLWVWQPATYFLLHPSGAVGWLVVTLAFLFFLGRELERSIGRWPYLRLYAAGGIVAGVLAVPWTYLFGAQHAHVQSPSGAVYAMTIGLALRHPNLPSMFGLPLWGLALFLLILHTAIALVMPMGQILSFFPLAGAAFAWAHYRGADRWDRFWSGLSERRRQRRTVRQAASEDVERERLDALLAKIQSEGIGALSPREKDFLQEASRKFR